MEKKNLEVLEILVAWNTVDREQGALLLSLILSCQI